MTKYLPEVRRFFQLTSALKALAYNAYYRITYSYTFKVEY